MPRIIAVDYRDVLRDIRIDEASVPVGVARIARRYGYRPYMVMRYVEMLGFDEAIKLLEAFEKKPPPAVRCNTLRISSCDELRRELEELGFSLKPLEWCPYCYRVVKAPQSPSLGATHQYFKGLYYVYRDAAPLLPPLLLSLKRGESVADVAAAPGGKATHLAQIMGNEGLLLANDKAVKRLGALIDNIVRMGVRIAVVTNFDARELPLVTKRRYSRVLLDAPCSAEGGIMFDPGRKTRTSIEDLARLVAREIEMLYASIELVESEGVVVYSTCSIAPEENEYVVTKVLSMRNDVVVEEVEPPIGAPGITEFHRLRFSEEVRKCVRTWPHVHGTEGFFVCVLRRVGRR